MSWDNLQESLLQKPAKSLYIMAPPVLLAGMSVLHSQMEIFDKQTQIIYLFYQLCFIVFIHKFMICNMAKSPGFTIFQIELFYPLVPILAHHVFQADYET
jgi:hypothetical protein